MNDIALQLQAYKSDTKMSQQELADMLHISQPHLSQILQGRRGVTGDMLKDMVKEGIVSEEIASLPEALKQKIQRMAYEDQCLIESFVNRMCK